MFEERSDEDLMSLYLEGETRAFQTIVDRHSRRVYNFILRRSGGRAEVAEDILQDTFVRVIRNAASFQRKAKFTTWLYTIARNLCIDALRKASYRRHPSLDQPISSAEGSGATLMDKVPNKDDGAEKAAHESHFKTRLEGALNDLPEEQKEVFVMREFQGLKFWEIAEIVGVAENTIKSRMRYALQGLRGSLAEFASSD
jgi:RNA polymerase sigma-70 factor (ECF subfamily)